MLMIDCRQVVASAFDMLIISRWNISVSGLSGLP
jgi:hypothetical protein